MKPPKIQFRTDYENFSFLNGNRPLNKKKIEKIEADIENGFNLLPYCPVIVFEKDDILHIVDGQHRFTVSKNLNLPVYYVVCDEINLYQIATMNSKQDKWTEKNFLDCYIELGNENYKILRDLVSEFKLGLIVIAEYLMNERFSRNKEIVEIFREGKFVVNHEESAREVIKEYIEIFGRYKFYNDRNLLDAYQKIRDKGKCDFEFLKKKIKEAPMLMDKQGGVKSYIFNIEKVYNHKASIRKIIY